MTEDMKVSCKILSALLILVSFFFSSCATGHPNVEDELISAYRQQKRTVQLKIKGGQELYIIDPTFKKAADGCPVALIRGWRGSEQFMEKEVEVCE
jgi:hypothetical protein